MREIFFAGTFFADREKEKKNAKIAKIRTRKNLVPHSILSFQIHQIEALSLKKGYLSLQPGLINL